MKEVQILRVDVSGERIERKMDYVAEERPLHILLNRTHYVTILCSPSQLKELTVGHLLSEGVLKSINDIRDIRLQKDGKCRVKLSPGLDVEKRLSVSQPFARLIVSACGSSDYWPLAKLIDRLNLPELPLGFTVEAKVILESVKQLNKLAKTFRKTGGVHVAALHSAKGELRALAEDVGRHNAVDKIVGTGILKRLSFTDSFLTSSGRLTGDIVLKSARMHIPVVASMSAATDSGVEAAQRTGLTLVGFARGKRMNVFTHPERIVFEAS